MMDYKITKGGPSAFGLARAKMEGTYGLPCDIDGVGGLIHVESRLMEDWCAQIVCGNTELFKRVCKAVANKLEDYEFRALDSGY